MKNKTVLVIAGSVHEFLEICKDKSLRQGKTLILNRAKLVAEIDNVEYRYIHAPRFLRGYHNVEVEWWGTANRREDAEEFRLMVESINRPTVFIPPNRDKTG